MIPKRPFWLATGAAIGAGSSLWVERRIRRTVQDAARRLQPDALAVEIGKSAKQIAGSTSERVRSAVSVGRDEMRQHEERLWQDLSERRSLPPRVAHPVAGQRLDGAVTDDVAEPVVEPRPNPRPDSTGRSRRRQRVVPRAAATKSGSHLGN
ncbi:MAG TPA: hypothetical protein VGG43_13885 [Acidimicrobiales bacterium]|jgi:hypothetical protein